MNKLIRNLIDELNSATKKYDEGNPVLSDSQWDALYFELDRMEKLTGIVYPDSPTQSIQYDIVNELNKVKHNHPMLSLEKTKDVSEMLDFINDKQYVMMAKMDGLTCSLKYIGGKLVSAETRGDGEIGEDILHNARVLNSIPQEINYKEELVIDGEIICDLETFKKFENEYSNPRNFAAGSIRLLDSKECSRRGLTFVAWDMIKGYDAHLYFNQHLTVLEKLGFTVVPYLTEYMNYTRERYEENAEEIVNLSKNYPIDGLVIKIDNIEYGKSLGKTDHHFNNAMAFKFKDPEYETELLDIEWTMGRTGVLTPVAIVKPIEIEGAIIERASLHNVTIMQELLIQPYVGQKVNIYRANMIIPQIAKITDYVEGDELDWIYMPDTCPCCGSGVTFRTLNNSTNLVCDNKDCNGQFINRLDHFCGKKGLDIKGLSKATLEKLIDWGYVSCIEDIFSLYEWKDSWIMQPGFGDKSVKNILSAINESRNCELNKFIASLGIPLIGSVASKQLAQKFKTWDNFINAVENSFEFYTMPNIGTEMDSAIIHFNYEEAKRLAKFLVIKDYKEDKAQIETLKGLTFVVTGKLKTFKNRSELKNYVESLGGKVTDSITSKTNYLVNNDITSTSSKNNKAKELKIPIITEEILMNLAKGEN